MADIPATATAHYRAVLGLQAQGVQASRLAWSHTSPSQIASSWAVAAPSLTATVGWLQEQAALLGSTYAAHTLADQGTYMPPSGFTDVGAFTGWLVDDDDPYWQVSLDGAVASSPVSRSLAGIKSGETPRDAMSAGGMMLQQLVMTAIADASRQAASVDLAARLGTGYVRMLNPPSCDRCTVLAGRWYRWNDGFQRHPQCDCVHVACTVKSTKGALREGLIDDPYKYFNDLSDAEQNLRFTKAGAQAIRDGADIYQVVNSRRSMSKAGRVPFRPATDPRRRWTLEGSTRNSAWVRAGGRGGYRLTPEGVYQVATSRDDAIRLLTEEGYILPAGQVPGGSIKGPAYMGFGQMGKGGAAGGARESVLAAIASGTRDPGNVYTMTAAERRVSYAYRDWQLALNGIDPHSAYAVELRGGSVKGARLIPSTPKMVADEERNYRFWLARNGQVYVPVDR